jgi:oligopeptide transport system substrate-binding protein
MQLFGRKIIPWLGLALGLAATVWAFSLGTLPPADFTFVNETEIKTVDPALVTGQPEGRIIRALFEGLVNWHPKTLEPVPGVAESWELSEDKKTYTLHLRDNARWSNGSPVTADDFVWSFRRFLHPDTASEYAYQLWYVTNAEKFTSIQAEVGDPVEIELPRTPQTPRGGYGELLHGKLVEILGPTPAEQAARENAPKGYVVEIDGRRRRFRRGGGSGFEDCSWVLVDFAAREGGVGIRAIDPRTLEITLANPTPYFLNLLGFYPLFPVNRQCVEQYGYPEWTKPENIVSNGPFLLKWRRIRDRVRMVKNDLYWNKDAIHINVMDALAVESTTTTFNLYMTGQVDWITNVPSPIIPILKQTRPDFQPATFLGIYYYRINVTRPPLDNPQVRKALVLAVDRQAILDTVARSGETAAHSYVPPGVPGYEPAECQRRNVDEARRLLAEAGYPGGKGCPPIEILFNTQDAHKAIAELLQANWKRDLGIDIKTKNQEWAVYQSDTRQLKYGLSRAGWIADYNDPNTFLDMFVTNGSNNQTGWGNARYDELIRLAGREFDPQKRMQYFHEAERILMDELPVIPLYYYASKNMIRPYVHGIYTNVQDTHSYLGVRVDQEEKREVLERERTL